MAALTLRLVKGAPLTNAELDANFSNLNADVLSRLLASSNLADLTNAGTARSNLGLGSVENKSSATIRSEITSSNVTTALGFTPYNATNPSGFITSSALTPYLTTTTAASTYQPLDADLTAIAALTPTLDNFIVGNGTSWVLETPAQVRTSLGLVIGTNVQAWDADLDSIAGLAGTTGFLRKTAANTWTLDTSTYLTGNQSITFTGDAAGSGTTSVALTLATSGVTAGTYTKVTVDAKGRVTTGASLASADLPTYTGSITSSQVTTALGFTPYNSTNPSGYITSAALSPYLTSATAASTYQPLLGYTAANRAGDTFTGNVLVNAGADSRFLVQSSGVTQGQLQATATAVRLASSNALPLYLSQNGVDLLDVTTTAIVGNRQFRVPNSASYNFAFVGEQTAGAGKWNLFMSGTAANHLAGPLAINTTFLNDYLLRVGGNMSGAATRGAVEVNSTAQSDVTSEARGIVSAVSTAASAFTVGQASAFFASQGTVGAGSAITTQVGFLVGSGFTGGATNNYGFRGAIPFGSGRWNLYMDGTADNFLAGKLGVGSTNLTNNLVRVESTFTGSSTMNAVELVATAGSGVTVDARGFVTGLGTQAASFTVPNLNHFHAIQATFGAGSTVTNQSGFLAGTTLIGATNNYGFRGAIPAGTGRWNLFMDGTADNFLAGNTGIGGSAAVNARLRVIGSGLSSEVARIEGGTLEAQMIINQTDDPAVNTNRAQLSLRKNNIIGATISIDGATANRGIVYYDALSATGSHAFFVNSIDRLRINAVGAVSFSGAFGNAGQLLKSGGSAGVPTWGALTSGEVTTALGFTPGAGDVTLTGTQTLTNKRVTPRSVEITSSATITPTSDTADQYEVTALAANTVLASPSGTPTDGQRMLIRIKDDGTARTLSWTTGSSGSYRAVGVTLPTTTTATKTTYVGCIYNVADARWDVVATATEA